jgi:serpin B
MEVSLLKREFNMKRIFWLILSITAIMAMVACNQAAGATELKSDKPRQTAPAVASADQSALVAGNTDFALSIYKLLKTKGGNLFYSPYSISQALAMTYGGASGQTETQMAIALRFQLAQAQLHPAFNSLDIELAKRGKGAKGTDGKGFRLSVVNAIWGQKDFKFTASYLDLLAQNYGAGMRIVDYIKQSEPARQTINQWVSDQTEGKIKDLLAQGAITPLTRLVLTNAIYFNAAWVSQFKKDVTRDGQFKLLNGSNVTVAMMKQQESFRYGETADYQAVELPYDGNELSMMVLLPKVESFSGFETALNNTQLKTILDKMNNSEVNLSMPKFTVNSEFSLNQALSDLGMPAAFSDSEADFSGMDGARDLYISDVVHKAFVSVDEAGTEAAAATGVVMSTTAMTLEIKEMKIDHPFIFFIRDNPTGTILFMGRVMNPVE